MRSFSRSFRLRSLSSKDEMDDDGLAWRRAASADGTGAGRGSRDERPKSINLTVYLGEREVPDLDAAPEPGVVMITFSEQRSLWPIPNEDEN